MLINIDSDSGFCFGVVYAIQRAEDELQKNGKLFCLGDIVHNNVEVKRLENKGLITINYDKFKKLKNCNVLIRAHGAAPETYKIALQNNIKLIDASCPVVLKLQKKIKSGFDNIHKKDGQLVIFGKKGHAEVVGLVGQTHGKGIVISDFNDLEKLDYTKSVNIFAQTTKSLKDYAKIQEEIKTQMIKIQKTNNIDFISNNSICGQVSNRDVQLRKFSKNHDIIIFVSGKKSSNGKMLYQVCKKENEKTYFVSDIEEIKKEWFSKNYIVGICGATSTPLWLMEKIKETIKIKYEK